MSRPLTKDTGRVLCLLVLLLLCACTLLPAPDQRAADGVDSLQTDLLGELEQEFDSLLSQGSSLTELRSLFLDIQAVEPDEENSRRDALGLRVANLLVMQMSEDPDSAMSSAAGEGIHGLNFTLEQYGDSLASDSLASLIAADHVPEDLDSLLAETQSTTGSIPGIPHVAHSRVEQMVDYFTTGKGRRHYEIWLSRYPAIAAEILPILREEEMPEDLIFLSMIESGFRIKARSHARAVGPWQFIASTGRISGLRVDYWVDERMDLEKSTRAAAGLLRSLYSNYEDWYLAMSAYNAGPGNIRKAIRRANGSRDFWKLRRLPAETRNYVPTYLAARQVFQQLESFGFDLDTLPEPRQWARIHVPAALNLDKLAMLVGTSEEQLRDWNPQFRRFCTAPDGSEVLVPVEQGEALGKAIAALPESDYKQWKRYKVRRGDTLSQIASRHGIGLSSLLSANKLKVRSIIRPGQHLLIPVPTGTPMADLNPQSRQGEQKGRNTWTVQSGDVLSLIAKHSKCSLRELRSWNKLKRDRIYPGQVLYTSAPGTGQSATATSQQDKTIVYTVRSGDTASEIAERYGIGLSRLRQANGLGRGHRIRVGQRLRIPDGALQASTVEQQAPAPQEDGSGTSSYRVKSGDTLEMIAKRHGLSQAELIRLNKLNRPDRIRVGQQLSLPAPQRPEETSIADSEIQVRSGDTIEEIAKAAGVSAGALMRENGIQNPRRIQPGQVLRIPQADKEALVAEAKARNEHHTVLSGETLWDLARIYGVSVRELKEWNSLSSNTIRPGKKLIVKPATES